MANLLSKHILPLSACLSVMSKNKALAYEVETEDLYISYPQMENPNKEKYDKWHHDPSNWKWGIFYYNKEDKRIFPPKKVKWLGWTINFANPYSALTFLLILVIIVIEIINLSYSAK